MIATSAPSLVGGYLDRMVARGEIAPAVRDQLAATFDQPRTYGGGDPVQSLAILVSYLAGPGAKHVTPRDDEDIVLTTLERLPLVPGVAERLHKEYLDGPTSGDYRAVGRAYRIPWPDAAPGIVAESIVRHLQQTIYRASWLPGMVSW